VEGAFAETLAVAAVGASVDEVPLNFLFLAAASSSEGKLIRENTLAFCFRSAAAAAAASAAVTCAVFDKDFVTGSDDFRDLDLISGSDDFLDVDLGIGSVDFLDDDSVRW